MLDLFSHIKGALALRHSKAAVVMCDYRAEDKNVPTIYDAIFTGKEWHCYKMKDTYKHSEVVKKGEQKTKASEYVWTNRVPERAGLYVSLKDYKQEITFAEYWKKIRECAYQGELELEHILKYDKTYSMLFKGKHLSEEEFLQEVKGMIAEKRRDYKHEKSK